MKTIKLNVGRDLRIPDCSILEGMEYAILDFGTESLGELNLRELKRAAAEMISEVLDNGVTPVVLSLPPMQVDRWIDGRNAYLWHEAANMELCRIACGNGVPFIDITTPMLSNGRICEMMCEDGLGLNRSGEAFVNTVINRELALI